jgi:COP9 signalosome complex subunit 2
MVASKADNPNKALGEFEGIVDIEEEKGEWYVFSFCTRLFEGRTENRIHRVIHTRGFKALKQATKLTFRLKHFEDSLQYYTRLLTYTKKAVTRKCARFPPPTLSSGYCTQADL